MKGKQYAQLEAKNGVFKNKKTIKNLNCTVLHFCTTLQEKKKKKSVHSFNQKENIPWKETVFCKS